MTALVAPRLRIGLVSAREELENLRGEWESLWLHSDDATPFQSPAWLLPWWRVFGKDQQLFTFTFREGDELVGLVPLFIWKNPEQRHRELLFIGTGITDWLGLLSAPGFESIVAEKFEQALGSFGSEWDVCNLQQLRPTCPLLARAGPNGVARESTTQTICPAINLSEKASRNRAEKMIARGQTYKRRLKLRGEAHMVAAQKTDFHEHFSAFLRLHDAEWKARGKAGVVKEKTIQEFHEQAARELLELSCLRLYSLYFNDIIISSFYGFGDGRQVYYYLGGFDPEFSAFSPGTIVVGHALSCALESGALWFDFLRGTEAYKYRWGATERPAFRLTCHSRQAT